MTVSKQQRSRRKVPEGTICYLCARPILPTDRWNRDHLPPVRLFASIVRKLFSLQLDWLYTHVECNSGYREDEEYAISVLAGHALSKTGNAVMADLRAAYGKGHSRGLIKSIVGSFGRVVGPRGEVVFALNQTRVDRFAWKLVRGIYYRELGVLLPERRPGLVRLINPLEAGRQLAEIAWFPSMQAAPSMGDAAYSQVFDYKWICEKTDELRGHAIGMLLWDRIIILVVFHDPLCACPTCVARLEAEQTPVA